MVLRVFGQQPFSDRFASCGPRFEPVRGSIEPYPPKGLPIGVVFVEQERRSRIDGEIFETLELAAALLLTIDWCEEGAIEFAKYDWNAVGVPACGHRTEPSNWPIGEERLPSLVRQVHLTGCIVALQTSDPNQRFKRALQCALQPLPS